MKVTLPLALILPKVIVPVADDEFLMFAVMLAFVQALMSPNVLLRTAGFKVTVPPDHTDPTVGTSVIVALIAPTAVRFFRLTPDPVALKVRSPPEYID